MCSWHVNSPEPKRPRHLFTPEEDEKLKKLYVECNGDYALIASKMGQRNERQCKDRYEKYLDPNLNTGDWTSEEDKLIMEYVEEHGRKWTLIASLFNRRSPTALKNRWNILERKRIKEEKKQRRLKLQNQQEIGEEKKESEKDKVFDSIFVNDLAAVLDNTQQDFLDFVF